MTTTERTNPMTPEEPLTQPGPGQHTEPTSDAWHPIPWPVWALIMLAALTIAATVVSH
jgi:hypothetical protein